MAGSTKGASKHRRDLINGEIGNLREMLPLPESARQRLSQLQIMSLACVYIRKCNYFARLFGNLGGGTETLFDFSQAMTGFLLITSREGKLLYISENVTEYLGHSMVDMMTQGDCIYDIIDKRDHATAQAQLLHSSYSQDSEEEKTFFCRMNVSRSFRRQAGFGDHKVMHVRGHFVQPMVQDHFGDQPVFVAVCSPLVTPDVKDSMLQNNTMTFQTVHGLDMKYMEIAPNGEYHLGYTPDEIQGKSWYELLHPDDVTEAKEKHLQLMKSSHEMGCMLTVRLQAMSGQWVWVNMVMHIRQPFVCDNGDPAIVCVNHVICEGEAQHFKLQSHMYSSQIARSPELFGVSPGATSPPHTITQVCVEREDQFPMGVYGAMHAAEEQAYYHGEFGVTVSAQTQSGLTDRSSEHMSLVDTHKSSFSDSGCEFGGGNKSPDQKQLIRADIISRLKRKMTESSSIAQQQCKPSKMMRLPSSEDKDGGFHSSESYSASAIVTSSMLFSDMGGDIGSCIAGPQVMASDNQGPVYAQLSLKKGVLSEKPALQSGCVSDAMVVPHSPLTPTSVVSEGSVADMTSLDGLTIDTTQSVFVPPSLLTPDASPACSPSSAHSEQCVPSMSEFGEIYSDPDSEMERPFQEKAKKADVCFFDALPALPSLDLLSVEKFFKTIETVAETGARPRQAKSERLSHQPVAPTQMAQNWVRQRVGSEASDNTDHSSELLCMSDTNFSSLLTGVGSEVSGIAPEPCDVTSAFDITANFMVVGPHPVPSPVLGVNEVVPQMAPQQLSPSHRPPKRDRNDELHQLNMMAVSSPHCGDEDVQNKMFDQTL